MITITQNKKALTAFLEQFARNYVAPKRMIETHRGVGMLSILEQDPGKANYGT